MSDPAEIAQQAQHQASVVQQAGGWPGFFGALAGALGVLGGLWRIIFGTRAERAEAEAQEDDALKHAAAIALRQAERADEETARHRVERDDYAARMDAMGRVIDSMRQDIADLKRGREECEQQNEALRREVRDARRLLDGLLMTSTPPPRYTGDDVRAAMPRGDDHG